MLKNIDALLKPETTLLERAVIIRALQIAESTIEERCVFPELAESRGEARLLPFFGLSLDEQLEAQQDLLAGIATYTIWEPQPPKEYYIIPHLNVHLGAPAIAVYEDKELMIGINKNPYAPYQYLICYAPNHSLTHGEVISLPNTPFEVTNGEPFFLLYEGEQPSEAKCLSLYFSCVENSTAGPEYWW